MLLRCSPLVAGSETQLHRVTHRTGDQQTRNVPTDLRLSPEPPSVSLVLWSFSYHTTETPARPPRRLRCIVQRRARLLRGGVGPELNHVVYFVGGPEMDVAGVSSNEAAIRDSAGEMGSFLAFAEAFAGAAAAASASAAAASACRSLPEVVVVTRGVHVCVESDMVR